MAIMEPVPAEIAIVRDLFAGFTGGASMRELLETSTTAGVPSVRGDDRADRRRRPIDLLLPRLPGEVAQAP